MRFKSLEGNPSFKDQRHVTPLSGAEYYREWSDA